VLSKGLPAAEVGAAAMTSASEVKPEARPSGDDTIIRGASARGSRFLKVTWRVSAELPALGVEGTALYLKSVAGLKRTATEPSTVLYS
jgi:hypothetical protein